MEQIAVFSLEIFELYIIYKFINIFFGERRVEKKIEFLAYFLKYVMGTIVMQVANYPLINFTIAVLFTFVITLCYEGTFSKRISVAFIVNMGKFLSEAAMAAYMGITGFSVINQSQSLNLFMLFMCEMIYWFITIIVRRFRYVRLDIQVPKIYLASIIVLQLISIALETIIFQYEYIEVKVKIGSFILVFLSNIIMVYLYDSLSKMFYEISMKQKIESEKMYYLNQCDLIQTNMKELEHFRHDEKNKLCVMQQMLRQGNTEDVMTYIEKIIGKLENVNMYSQSGNLTIDSIINYKLAQARKINIEVSTNIVLPEKLPILEDEVVVLLGNILDNALEAVTDVETNKMIYLNIEYDKGCIVINQKNTYMHSIKKKNQKFITTKKDEKLHGLGIESMESVLLRCGGTKHITYDDNVFSISIILPVDN